MSRKKQLFIHGIRGIPATHGGFETFTEKLAPYLVEHGWDVTVYCQELGDGEWYEGEWNGVKTIHVPVSSDGAKGSIIFDWLTVKDAIKKDGLNLTLGYNTAVYSMLFRLKGKTNVFNMDGIEWKRQKWSLPAKIWFFLNECAGNWLGNHLIADHPQIKKHLQARVSGKKITVIPYGADRHDSADAEVLKDYGLTEQGFYLVVARPEPENSILEIVSAYSSQKRNYPLVVLGNFDVENNAYHKKVVDSASEDVKFVGAIYDHNIVNAFRFYTRAYIHGHQVGGTNPSLVETLGCGSPVLAHNNRFNRWVAGEGAKFFQDQFECKAMIDQLDASDEHVEAMRAASYQRHSEDFQWEMVMSAYNDLLTEWYDRTEQEYGEYEAQK